MFKHFNFGNSLIRWIKLFYTDAKSCVPNNGHMSNFFFNWARSAPRLPSFSLSIYNLYRYYCLIKSVQSTSLKVYVFPEKNSENLSSRMMRLSFWTVLFRSFETLINILDNFANISDLKLNARKCQVLRIGSLTKSEVIYLKHRKFQWNSSKATALGMTFTTNKKSNFQVNLEPKIADFEKCLMQWQHRKLTLMGKITVIKSLALPKLIYVLSSLLNPPKDTIKQIEKNHVSIFLGRKTW